MTAEPSARTSHAAPAVPRSAPVASDARIAPPAQPTSAQPTAAKPTSAQPTAAIFASLATRGVLAVTALTAASMPLGVVTHDLVLPVAFGAVFAVLVGKLALLLQVRAVLHPMPGPHGAQRFQIALFGSFVGQWLAIGVALIAMSLADVKFAALAAFGVAFAANAMAFQVVAILGLQSLLRARGLRRPETADPTAVHR